MVPLLHSVADLVWSVGPNDSHFLRAKDFRNQLVVYQKELRGLVCTEIGTREPIESKQIRPSLFSSGRGSAEFWAIRGESHLELEQQHGIAYVQVENQVPREQLGFVGVDVRFYRR